MSETATLDQYLTTVTPEDRKKTFYADWETWHQNHLSRLADPYGFLAITGLHWVEGDAQKFAGVPGEWLTRNKEVVVILATGETLSWQGQTLEGEFSFGELTDNTSIYAEYGDTKLEIARRSGLYLLRPRNPGFDTVKNFKGVPAYYPDAAWRVAGKLVRHPQPQIVTVDAVVEGLSHTYRSPGYIEFTLRGETLRLTAFESGDHLQLLFTDKTSGKTTSAKQRALSVAAPGSDDQVVLDFNRAINLMCAYTPAATCPLPPPENHLPVAIEAGEKLAF